VVKWDISRRPGRGLGSPADVIFSDAMRKYIKPRPYPVLRSLMSIKALRPTRSSLQIHHEPFTVDGWGRHTPGSLSERYLLYAYNSKQMHSGVSASASKFLAMLELYAYNSSMARNDGQRPESSNLPLLKSP
jgi:hypothetical protein